MTTIQESEFEELFRRYQPKVYALCLRIVHDEALASDLTQEAFLHAYSHLSSLREPTLFSHWLMKIAKNLSLTQLKKQKDLSFRDELLVEQKSEERILEEEERDEKIEAAIKELSPKQREIFELYHKEKLSHKEIAYRLDIPIGTSRSRLHYARCIVRKYIQTH